MSEESKEIIIANPNNTQVVDISIEFGKYSIKSSLCDVCKSPNHMLINSARGQHYRTIDSISDEFQFSKSLLKRHFEKHFILSDKATKILDLNESTSAEAREIVKHMFDKNIDLVEGANSMLRAKAQTLQLLYSRRKDLYERQELNDLEAIETQEYLQLNRLILDAEDAWLKALVTIDKKIFSSKEGGLSNAILEYKLTILSSFLDKFQLVFLKYEKRSPEHKEMIQEMRVELAQEFNKIEDEILRAGGMSSSISLDS